MIVQLNEFILPSSLMESFDVYREESVKSAARCFNDAQLSWFLDMLNRFRGSDDRKDSLVDIFDPGMYTCDHPAWEAAPGTRIEMPALTSEVARLADRNSEFVEIAKEEINEFRDHAETYADDEILGLAQIAAAALVDQGRSFHGREEAIRYLALNASAVLEAFFNCASPSSGTERLPLKSHFRGSAWLRVSDEGPDRSTSSDCWCDSGNCA
jgi:hypothetical protein